MATEKLNINQPPATIMVGCGGVGSEIIMKVAEMCRYGETENIRFVVMDTNANDLKRVMKSDADLTAIQTSSPQRVIDYLYHDNDARLNWFPNNKTLYDKTVSEGAGQVRAISRLALNAIIKNGEIKKLYRAIDDLFLKDGLRNKQALRVVIAATAAGGTGSGIAMIVGMLVREYLRKQYPEKAAIIRAYLILPGVMDTVISSDAERENLRRNAYATIKEINAFMMKYSGFCDVRPELYRYRDLHIDVPNATGGTERLESLPFDFCFLLDRVDYSQETMQTLGQYKNFAAQNLYEQNIGPMQEKAFGMEDNIIREFAAGDNLGRNRFGGLGSSVLVYPYEDVVNYVAYTRAMDRIGSGETVGEWLKYDRAYKTARAEFKKNRTLSSDAEPTLAEIYTSTLLGDSQRFGKDIKSYLTSDQDETETQALERINSFLDSLHKEMVSSFDEAMDVAPFSGKVLERRAVREYSKENKPNAKSALNVIRGYQEILKKSAGVRTRSRTKAIFRNGPDIRSDVQAYHLESLLKTPDGAIHPNAVRYMLYALKTILQNDYKNTIQPDLIRYQKSLENYQPSAKSTMFEIEGYNGNAVLETIDAVCGIEEELEKFGSSVTVLSDSKYYEALNIHLPAYCKLLLNYRDTILKEAEYSVLLEYVNALCEEFEQFYADFESKVKVLEDAKDEIVSKLRFEKGDNVRYVCGKEEHLERLAQKCPEGSDGLLLPESLNAEIYEAIKKNADSERAKTFDPSAEITHVDIFDEVLIDYFRRSVREDCADVIDLNIIRALRLEKEFEAYTKANYLRAEEETEKKPHITHEMYQDYIEQMIGLGRNLAETGISYADFKEARVVRACAYNAGLADMRDIDVADILESEGLSPVMTDTVSRYELRFFNALYNITPDNISRFKAPRKGEYSGEGLYHYSYQEYAKKIGPDSTKCATISTHIDRRWESIRDLPDLSVENNYQTMLRIHSALIYGVCYHMIKKEKVSHYDEQMRYTIEDRDGNLIPLIVANGSECDMFYEVLDALYRDRESVVKLHTMADCRCDADIEGNTRYESSEFARAASRFYIESEDAHSNVLPDTGETTSTSLFEIPLAYYNSIPRARRDDNELSVMIDSVIHVLDSEVEKYEQELDHDPYLADLLMKQFDLLMKNFRHFESIRKKTTAEENPVLAMTLRKLISTLKNLKISRCSEKIEALHQMMKESAKTDTNAADEN